MVQAVVKQFSPLREKASLKVDRTSGISIVDFIDKFFLTTDLDPEDWVVSSDHRLLRKGTRSTKEIRQISVCRDAPAQFNRMQLWERKRRFSELRCRARDRFEECDISIRQFKEFPRCGAAEIHRSAPYGARQVEESTRRKL